MKDDDKKLKRRSAFNSAEQRIYDLTNQARRNSGMCGSNWYLAVSELRWNDQLTDAARKHAQDMRDNNYFSHTSKDSRSPWTRIKNAGYNCGSATENIAMNGNVDNTVTSWLNSPGHCANIMSGNKQIGISMAYTVVHPKLTGCKYSVDARIHVVILRTILSFIFFLIVFILRITKF